MLIKLLPKIVTMINLLAVLSCFTFANALYIHVHRPPNTPNELGIYCSNGNDPTVVGMEEKYLIVSCGK
jgi:hypothetical protein